ncbi:MAG: Demethylrebeccamycin-D-glucose O-methyltransferase [Candidatus Heimdallarchaeota archaeon LC_3]|nr:MAG: Demethylrebeccamycin-D-glucose O-methyltransferase [Candidatus Heimdallarchaeota archaeon LC_3]
MVSLEFFKSDQDFSSACCNFYENKHIQTFLGPSFHPGGLALTKELGLKLGLRPSDKILDLASGIGTTAIFLAKKFGSSVTGIDLSHKNVIKANTIAKQENLDHRVKFKIGNAEQLSFKDQSFDVVIIECSFCLFQNKISVSQEIYRVLKDNGRIGVSDIVIEKKLPFEIEQMIFQVACLANALSTTGYTQYFKKSGLKIQLLEHKSDVLIEMLSRFKKMLFVAELVSKTKKINLGNISLSQVKNWLREGEKFIQDGSLNYLVLIAKKVKDAT